ncbi:Hint domain-containing protein [Streptomyces sp. NPDC087901]|uniref:Hint domain-containing protein n=1 Tax=Streptomyces sp. NPDC087901 TaxID=3365818 RepID=UPI00380F31C6
MPAHAPGPVRGRSRLPLLSAGAGVLVLALLAWLLFVGDDDSEGPVADGKESAKADPRVLQPYRLALAGLAVAPGLRYKDESPGGMMKREATVTSVGSRFGSSGFGRKELDREFLSVGGKTFTRWRVDPAAKNGARKPSVWDAGESLDSGLSDELTKHRPSPPELANQFFEALAELEQNPPVGGYSSGSRTVGSTEAQALDTSAGQLVITRKEPFRVLRLEPPSGFVPGAAPSRSTGSASYTTVRTAADPDDTGPFDGADTLALDVEPVAEADAPAMYDTLEKQTRELGKASDSGISLSLNGSGTVRCSSGGCTAASSFSGQVASDAKSRLVGGQVTAVMTSTFSIDGQSGGSCTSPPGTFSLSGSGVSGSLTCSNPGAGATFSSVESRKKAEARARSRASGGRAVQYSIPLRANSLISARALATVEVKKLVAQVRKERKRPPCSTSHSFPAGTPVLLANGSRRPIEEVRSGDRVLSTDPVRDLRGAQRVTRQIVTSTDKNFTRLELATADGPAALTVTDNHPFWSRTANRWRNASELRAGEKLTGVGASPEVAAAVDVQGTRPTYDLTVEGIHTYYVLAGTTPVLVHNNNCPFGMDAASSSGARIDPHAKGGRHTVAGRALEKHVNKKGGGNPHGWPTPSGKKDPAAWNAVGQDMLVKILTHPGARVAPGRGNINGRYQDVIDIRMPDERGARFDVNGNFSGFLDPYAAP